ARPFLFVRRPGCFRWTFAIGCAPLRPRVHGAPPMIASPARPTEAPRRNRQPAPPAAPLGDPGQALWRRWLAELGLELRARCCVRDDGHAGPAARVEERLVQAVWADRLYRADELVTASGKKVEVLEPGRWNTSR